MNKLLILTITAFASFYAGQAVACDKANADRHAATSGKTDKVAAVLKLSPTITAKKITATSGSATSEKK